MIEQTCENCGKIFYTIDMEEKRCEKCKEDSNGN